MSRSYDSRVLRALQDYKRVARRVKEIVRRLDPEARVYVFGSVVRGEYTGASDIDILVVTERPELRHRIMVEVYRHVDAPVELHIASRRQFENWYLRFIEPDEIVEV